MYKIEVSECRVYGVALLRCFISAPNPAVLIKMNPKKGFLEALTIVLVTSSTPGILPHTRWNLPLPISTCPRTLNIPELEERLKVWLRWFLMAFAPAQFFVRRAEADISRDGRA